MMTLKVVKPGLNSLKFFSQGLRAIHFFTQHIITFVKHVLNLFKSLLLLHSNLSKFRLARLKIFIRFIFTRHRGSIVEYLGTFCPEAIGGSVVITAFISLVGEIIFCSVEDRLADKCSSKG